MINYNFKNKVVLVTGSSRGIGKEVAYSFLKSGAIVILTGRKITTNSKLKISLKIIKISLFYMMLILGILMKLLNYMSLFLKSLKLSIF